MRSIESLRFYIDHQVWENTHKLVTEDVYFGVYGPVYQPLSGFESYLETQIYAWFEPLYEDIKP